MKKGLTILVLAITAIGYISCEKPNPDYREKWVGTYECKKEFTSSYPPGSTGVSYPLVDVVAVADSMLNLTERDISPNAMSGVHNNVKVNSDGSFSKIDGNRPYIEGNFYKDSIKINYSNGSAGGTITAYYTGKKLKNVKQ